jgi:hypothetical protein
MSIGRRLTSAAFIVSTLLLIASLTAFWGVHYFGPSSAYGWGKSALITGVALVLLVQLEDRFKGPKLDRLKPIAMLAVSVAVAALTWAYISGVLGENRSAKGLMEDAVAMDAVASKPGADVGARIMVFDQNSIITPQTLTSLEANAEAKERVQGYRSLIAEREATRQTYVATMTKYYSDFPPAQRDEALKNFGTMRDGLASVYADISKAQLQWVDSVTALLYWAAANNSRLRMEGARVSAADAEVDGQLHAQLLRVQASENNVNAVLDDTNKRRLALKQLSDETVARVKAAR